MSLVAMTWAWEQDVASGAKLVLLALADRANEDDGTCWPGIKTVARKVGLSERVVRKHVESLEVLGLLRREVRTRGDGSQTSNLIVLCMTGGAVTGDRGGLSPVTGRTEPTGEPTSSPKVKKGVLAPADEPVGFAQWLGQHVSAANVVGIVMTVPRASTSRRSTLARAFKRLVAEGHELEEFRLASLGVLSSQFMREGGYVSPENVLRVEKFGRWVDEGRRAEAAAAAAPTETVDWSRFDD
jgi:GntR family transcriptional regulator